MRIDRNTEAANYVERREVFYNKNRTIFSAWRRPNNKEDTYIVYSYGYHFPMYIHTHGRWFGNEDKYSITTTRHQNICRPSGPVTYLDTDTMIILAHHGYTGTIKQILKGKRNLLCKLF